LNEHLIAHPEATFFLRVRGESMTGAGIHDGDILIVDRAMAPGNGRVVVAALSGELTVKRLRHTRDGLVLAAEHPGYPDRLVTPDMDFEVWGVVRHVIHSL
jgi:DNA polymerase V